jgi:osmotically-inducible protein OsmY
MQKLKRIAKFLVCLGLTSAFLGCPATQTHQSTGQYFDDSVITTRVKAAIVDEMPLKGFQINVTTYQGVVLLSGLVDSPQKSHKAAALARTITGVLEVKNELMVQ